MGFLLFAAFFLLFGCVYPVEQFRCLQVDCGPNCCLKVLSIHAEGHQVATEFLVDAASYAYGQGDVVNGGIMIHLLDSTA